MKRNQLTTAICDGIDTGSQPSFFAVHKQYGLGPAELCTDGLEQTTIYPYFETNKNPKSVKVRFLEGITKADVIEHDAYLSEQKQITANPSLCPNILISDSEMLEMSVRLAKATASVQKRFHPVPLEPDWLEAVRKVRKGLGAICATRDDSFKFFSS